MTPLAWVAALLVVGLLTLALEVFVPSGGVLGFLSVVALLSGVVLAFVEQGPMVGMTVLAAACLAVPLVLAAAFRIFPATPLGRRVLPPPPGPADVVPDADRRAVLRALVGRRGITTSELLPWGSLEIDGIAHEAVSEGGPIASDVAVEVAGVQGTALMVRAVDSESSTRPPAPIGPIGTVAAGPEPPAIPRALEAALEAFDFDALDSGHAPETSPDPEKLDSPPTPNKA
ncbi:MAG: NfeD family protein [Pirellulales bacterium]